MAHLRRSPIPLLIIALVVSVAALVVLVFGQQYYLKTTPASLPSGGSLTIQPKEPVLPWLEQRDKKQPEYVPNRIIVKFKEGAPLPEVRPDGTLSIRAGSQLASFSEFAEVRTVKKLFPGTVPQVSTLQGTSPVGADESNLRMIAQRKSQEFGLDRIFVIDVDINEENVRRELQLLQTKERTIVEGMSIDEENGGVLLLVSKLSRHTDIEYTEPDYFRQVFQTTNDPYFSSSNSWGQGYDDLWSIKKIQSQEAWSTTKGENIIVAVIDTGVDWQHPDLAANIWSNADEIPNNNTDDDRNGYVDDVRGWDFVSFGNNRPDNDPSDEYGHGTHVAGTIAAVGNNSIGVIGVAPRAKIMPLKGLDPSGSGTSADLAKAVRYAADNGAHVSNSSWGGPSLGETLKSAFAYADALGVVNVAAAGNSNKDVEFVAPASYPSTIAVAAVTQRDEKAVFSNYGRLVNVSAPGSGYASDVPEEAKGIYNILSTMSDNSVIANRMPVLRVSSGYYRLAGTSMATPHVAGVAALIRSHHLNWSSQLVKEQLVGTTDDISGQNPGYADILGTGRVNARKAVTENPRPALRYVTYEVIDTAGDDDQAIDPGETVEMFITLESVAAPADDPVGVLSTSNPQVTILQNIGSYPDQFRMGQKAKNVQAFRVRLSSSAPRGVDISFVLQVTAREAYSRQFSFNVEVPHQYAPRKHQAGWPVLIEDIPFSFSIQIYGALVVDLEGDGRRDILTTYSYSREESYIDAFEYSGVRKLGFPLRINGEVVARPTVGDADRDGKQEIVVNYRDPGGFPPHNIAFYKRVGAAYQRQWEEKFISQDKIVEPNGEYTMDDVDRNGDLEIVMTGTERLRRPDPYIIGIADAWHHNGSHMSGWPIRVPEYRQLLSVAMGNIVGDPKLEIVTSSGYEQTRSKEYAWNGDGSAVTSWPYTLDGRSGRKGPQIADLDKDGKYEVIQVEGENGSVQIINGQGQRIRKLTPPGNQSGPSSMSALGDVDGDGDLEIFVYTEAPSITLIHGWHHDGSKIQGWPIRLGENFVTESESPLVGDVDSDGTPDVLLIARNGEKYAFRADGSPIPGWPYRESTSTMYSLMGSLTDIDGDSDVELVYAYRPPQYLGEPGSLGVDIIDLAGTYGRSTMHWPMYQHDPQHTGRYERPGSGVSPSPSVSPTPATDYGLQYVGRNRVGSNVTVKVKRNIPTQHIGKPHDVCFSRSPSSITHTGTCRNIGGYPDQWREESITFPISYQQDGANYIHLRRQGLSIKQASYNVP